MTENSRKDSHFDWHVSLDYCIEQVHKYEKKLACKDIPDKVRDEIIADRQEYWNLATELCSNYVDLVELGLSLTKLT